MCSLKNETWHIQDSIFASSISKKIEMKSWNYCQVHDNKIIGLMVAKLKLQKYNSWGKLVASQFEQFSIFVEWN